MKLSAVQLALRASIGAATSIVIAELLSLQYPAYAAIAAVIVTDLKTQDTAKLGKKRLIATALGVLAGAGFALVLPPGAWAAGLSIGLTMLMCYAAKVEDAARIAGFICGVVVLTHNDDALVHALSRFAETVIGIVVAWTISKVPKLLSEPDADAAEN